MAISSFARWATISFVLAAPLAGQAALSPYSQNFESMSQASATALSGDGWKVFGNVFNPDGSYVGGYGVFGAPNNTGGFSNVASGQGGASQGNQQLVVFSDYNNADKATKYVEALVFQERTISAADAGTWEFKFDAKRGDLEFDSTAYAFIKTLNPAAGFATTGFVPLATTAISQDWNSYSVTVDVTAGQANQLLQFGFAAISTMDRKSGVYYDNVSFAQALAPIPEPETYAMMLAGLAVLGSFARRRSSKRGS